MMLRATRRWTLRVLAVLVALSVTFSTMAPAAGGPVESQAFYVPWVSNAEYINGTGPWFGKLSFQNLDSQTCSVSIVVGRTGSWSKVAQLSIAAGSSRSISANSLALPEPGAPVRLEANCSLTASVKMVTPDSRRSPWSDGAMTVTGYTGLASADLDSAANGGGNWLWTLPIVQTNSDWNSIIRVTNFHESTGSNIAVRFYAAGNIGGSEAAVATVEDVIPPGASVEIDVLEVLGLEGWVGSAEIISDGPVGAFTVRSKPSTRMAITNMASSAVPEPASGRYLLAAPLLFNAYNGWNTGINLANLGDGIADISIRYFAVAGGLSREITLQMAPHSMQYIYTPNNIDEEGFVGSAMIESNQPVVAAIDEVKYETTEAISYIASSVGQVDAAIPITFREDPHGGRNDNSGINVQNMNPDAPQTVQIRLITNTGAEVLAQPFSLTLPPGSNNFVYFPDWAEIPVGTVAAARITSQDSLGFVAISNDVNYAVPGDGSVTFVASGEAGYYRMLGSPAP